MSDGEKRVKSDILRISSLCYKIEMVSNALIDNDQYCYNIYYFVLDPRCDETLRFLR
jgi:hypothetical protein